MNDGLTYVERVTRMTVEIHALLPWKSLDWCYGFARVFARMGADQ